MVDHTLDISDVPLFTKLEVAEHQLDRALRLLMEEGDHVSSITLAGASEEILGKMLHEQGKENDLQSYVRACRELGIQDFGEEWPAKEFVSIANYFRDGLKHYKSGDPISVPFEAAVEIIDRAIANYWNYTGNETNLMKQFMKRYHSL